MKKRLPVVILSMLFGMSALTGCNAEDFQNMKNDYQTQIDEIKAEIEEINTKISDLKDEMDASIDEVKEDYTAKINAANSEITTLQAALSTLETKHDQELEALEADYNAKITALESSLATNVSTLQTSINTQADKITALQKKHDEEVAALRLEYDQKLANQEATDVAARAALKLELDTAIAALDEELGQQVAALNDSISANTTAIVNLTNKHNEDVASVTIDYTAKINALEEGDEAARQVLEEEMEAAIAELDEEFASALALLQQSVTNNTKAISDLVSQHSTDVASVTIDYTAKINALEEGDEAARQVLEEEMEAAIAELDEEFAGALSLLQQSVASNTDAISALTTKHSTDVTNLTNDYNEKIATQEESDAAARAALKLELDTKISNLNEEFAAAVLELQASITANSTALTNFINEYNTQKTAIQNDYNTKIQGLDDKYIEETASIRSEIDELRNEVISLTSEMNTTISNIQNDYVSKINALTSRVSALEEVEYHTVSFVIEGHNPFQYESQIVKHGEKAIKPNFEVQDGYNFTLGNTFYVQSGHGFEPWYFKSSAVTEDIELHAYAEAYSYSIHLDENYPGGSTYYMADKVYSGDEYYCAMPERTGYVFEGWYTTSGEQVTDANGKSLAPFNFAADVEFVAYWHSASGQGTEDNPFTPAEARTYIEENASTGISSERIYVGGIVSSKTEFNTDYENFNIFFQNDDGTDEEYLQVFRCKLANDISYNSIQPGYYVVCEGYAKKYSGKYELCPDSSNANNPTTVYFEYRAPVLQDIKLEDKVVQVGSNITLSVIPIPSYAPIADIDDAIWTTTSTNIEVSTYEGGVEGISEGIAEVTVTIGSMSASCTITVVTYSPELEDVTFNSTAQGYTNQQTIESWSSGDITITFDKGSNNNPPKYYDSGNAIRVYGGNTFTVSTSSGKIRTIVLTLNGNGNEITVVKGTLSGTTWTGDESSITFFVEGTSGHAKVVSIAISYLPA